MCNSTVGFGAILMAYNTVGFKNPTVLQLFISRMPKMLAQLVGLLSLFTSKQF